MNQKVLLADDSLTIQKVIKITLANQPYEIIDCSTEEELFKKLDNVEPKLVLLDFNLSDKFSGYELTSKIKAASPNTKVLLLLGTFDTLDDASFEKSGASDKIVKPFDSNKFISICKRLMESEDEDDTAPAPSTPSQTSTDSETESSEDQWTVSHSTEHKLEAASSPKGADSTSHLNPLHNEISDWGMSIPGVIDQGSNSGVDEHMELPPVINEEKAAANARPRMPNAEDLDYPTTEASTLKSNLISIDSFRQEDDNSLEVEGNYVADESDVSKIEDQIRDEVEVDLWKADDFEDMKKEIESKVESHSSTFRPSAQDFDDSLFKGVDDQDSISWPDTDTKEETPHSDGFNVDQDSSQAFSSLHENQMEELVKKYVKEYLDEMFGQKVEKVAWDVIPDLAENLIRQELSKIADKVLKETK